MCIEIVRVDVLSMQQGVILSPGCTGRCFVYCLNYLREKPAAPSSQLSEEQAKAFMPQVATGRVFSSL